MWEFEHSVETTARRDFVWGFWTDVNNWAFDTSVEWVRLDGPFAGGTKGVTKSPGSDPVHWVLKEVQAEKAAIFEFSLADAVLRFHWRFEDIPEGGTRITQRATFTGADTVDFVRQVAPEFEKGIPDGMSRLVAEAKLAEERQRKL
jgi:Polyketide cyclase / dehydrase and lipid transport